MIQRRLGHRNLGITSVYLRGIDNAEIIGHRPRPPRADDLDQRLAAAPIAESAFDRAERQGPPATTTDEFARGAGSLPT